MITPTNGRIVLFTPASYQNEIEYQGQKLAAQICHVWHERRVNLLVTDADGAIHAVKSVKLLQDDDVEYGGMPYCEWMPYQKGQAAKTEALEAKAGQ